MVEVNNTVAEMKHAFSRLIGRLHTAEDRISQLEEPLLHWKPKWKKKKAKNTNNRNRTAKSQGTTRKGVTSV